MSLKHDEVAQNNMNINLHTQPWYVEFLRSQGQNPQKVHLSDQQRHMLQTVAAQHDVVLPDGVNFDPSGNVNEQHGFAGQPTWLKGLEIGGTLAGADILSGGALHAPLMSAIAHGGGSVPVSSLSSMSPTAAGAGGGGSLFSSMAGMLKNPSALFGAGSRALGAVAQSQASNRGTAIDATMAHDQMQLAADRERRAAESDAYRKSLYGQIAAGYQPSQRPAGVPTGNGASYITDQARQAGQMITDTAMNRMKTQDYGAGITPLSQLPMKPGLMERIASYAAPALSLFDPRLYGQTGKPNA